jgi:hypothetical protein
MATKPLVEFITRITDPATIQRVDRFLEVELNHDGPCFEFDSRTGVMTANGESVRPGESFMLRIKSDGSGRFEKTIERIPPPPAPIGPMFLCQFHSFEQFESGPCPDCYDEADFEDYGNDA